MSVEVFYKDSSNLYKPFAVKFKFDVCQLLKNKPLPKPLNFV